ncbi:Hsp70 suppressor, GTPase facilitates ribosomal subunit dissociation [Serendipita sp. 399]|nr:Hsp70 suppressor, GTPase facilitates ribosomal subunit dissociation [Serendipita sp. 399]
MDLATAEKEYEALSDGGEDPEDEITPEQLAQMNSVREHVRALIGPPKASGITDREIDDASWDYYFDLDQTMDHILEVQSKRNAAKERQASEEITSPSVEVKLSKLQLLSLAKKAEQASSPKSLASFTKTATSPLLGELKSPNSDHGGGPERPLSKLAQLSAKTKLAAAPTSNAKVPPVSPPGISKLAQKINASKALSNVKTGPSPSQTLPAWEIREISLPTAAKAPAASAFGSVLAVGIKPINRSLTSREGKISDPPLFAETAFKFDCPSPDDIVIHARPAKEREKQERKPSMSRTSTPRAGTPTATSPTRKNKQQSAPLSGTSTPLTGRRTQLDVDMLALNLVEETPITKDIEEPPKMTLSRERVLEEAKKAVSGQGNVKGTINLIIIGHVDAGKSTLTGRLLYELGRIESRKRAQTERASEKSGKGSFSWAWELDSGEEERTRGITIDIAQTTIPLPTKTLVVLDAPGHKDFVPNMISGASQADCALLLVDATTGEFEAGFEKGGQTREHLLLVRSLGVQQLVVAVNKLDNVEWSKDRFDEIVESLSAFLVQTGFHSSKTAFVPVAGFLGVNLVDRSMPEASELNRWYSGPTLVELLGQSKTLDSTSIHLNVHADRLEPPGRGIEAPFRFPVTNVFRGQSATSSGFAVAGRICSGVIQVGERVRVVPGDESAVVKIIESDGESLPWAAAGSTVGLYLSGIDPIQLRQVLANLDGLRRVELFHHARNIPATVMPLETLDRVSGAVIKKNPRVLSKGMAAKIRITLRGGTISESSTSSSVAKLPLETFKANKDMGRVLLRRNGETIAAGIVLSIDT